MTDFQGPDTAAIAAARARIAPYAVVTLLLESPDLNVRLGARILFKPETLQRAGSFKFRGAMNRALQLTETEMAGGMVAWSSGNHGLALSRVARDLGIKATILMPQEAPRTKIEGVRANGATVRLYDKTTEVREDIGARIAAETGAVIVPPYDDPYVMTGQATLGAEFAEQAVELGLPLDAMLLACSGGGLASGAACGAHGVTPQTAVFSVEPEGYDGMARSLAAATLTKAPGAGPSICDALLVPVPGKLTFPVCARHLQGGFAVTDAEVRDAIRFAYAQLKLVVEPGGAAPLAALLAGRLDVAQKTVGIVLSGGNVDAAKFAEYITETA